MDGNYGLPTSYPATIRNALLSYQEYVTPTAARESEHERETVSRDFSLALTFFPLDIRLFFSAFHTEINPAMIVTADLRMIHFLHIIKTSRL